jgi:hypothetical protein
MIEGVEIKMGDRTYTVPPLNFRQLKKYSADLARFSTITNGGNPYDGMTLAVPVITAAIQRNYPDVTEDEVSDMIDMGNYRRVLEAVMGVSGIADAVLRQHKAVVAGESKDA